MKSVGAGIATILAILLVISPPTTSHNTQSPRPSGVDRVATYSFAEVLGNPKLPTSVGPPDGGLALASISPGFVIGHTWDEYQRNGSMRRMTGWGQHVDTTIDTLELTLGCTSANPCTTITDYFINHFAWTYAGSASEQPRYVYQAWVAPSGGVGALRYLSDTPIQPTGQVGAYVVLDVTNDDRAVIGGSNSQPRIYWDRMPAAGFYRDAVVPDSVVNYNTVQWPAMAYQEGDGSAGFSDTVTHVFAQDFDGALYYIRKVGGSLSGSGGVWDYPARIVDKSFVSSQDVFASHHSGKVAIAWTAPRPDPGDCDTCSSNTGYYSVGNAQLDNDLYYQVSLDQGATWQPRVNLTKRPHPDSTLSPNYWPFVDLSLLIDQDDDEVHLVWNAHRYIPGSGDYGSLACRIFHWGEELGFTTDNDYGPGGTSDGKSRAILRTVYAADWNPTTCNGGAWELNASKMTISQCNGKHYVIWEQFNDIPHGVEDDCAERAFLGNPSGSANGEIFMSVSGDDGLTWDYPRNLTKSYSPHCDPNSGTPCESDVFPSMSPYGYNYSGDLPSNLVIPDNGTDNGWYLDVQYVSDPDAGMATQNEGTWQQAGVKWFRIPCVDPVPSLQTQLEAYPYKIDFPTMVHHGEQKDISLKLCNIGNITVNYSVNILENTGPTGWLTVSGFTGTILPGLNNTDTGTVHLNTGGIVNAPGTIVALLGGLELVSNLQTSPDTIPVRCWVADTVVAPELDTISNAVFSLVVSDNGNMGNSGDGGVNMDFVHVDGSGPDCDPANNVVLYDGSPFVMWVDGTDTVANLSVFSDGWLSNRGFRPRVGKYKFESYLYECYSTGVFSTNDSSIFLEKTWYSPKNYGDNDQGFFVECIKLWSADGLGKNNITVGEAIDWDVPSDTGADNSSGFVYNAGSPVFNLIYQQGANYHDGDTTECQNNAMRYAGIAPRGTYVNGQLMNNGGIYDAFTIDNPTYVIPQSRYDPQQLYNKIDTTFGYEIWVPATASPDSEYVDLSTVVTNLHKYYLGANDTLTMYYVLASSKNTPPTGQTGEFFDWINSGVAFTDARVTHSGWKFPNVVAVDASTMTFAGDVTGGTASAGATVAYDVLENATTVTGTTPIAYTAPENVQLILTSVGSSPTAFFRSRWHDALAPDNLTGYDTVVFLHEGEGLGAAKAAAFSWYESVDPAVDLAANFANPESDPNLSLYSSGFIQPTANLTNYTGWSPEVPSGNDVGVPRTINQTVFDMNAIASNWLYLKTTTDAAGGPYADGTQIEGFKMSFGCCVKVGDVNHSGGGTDIADVTYLVAYAFKHGPAPVCFEEADINGDCEIGLEDIIDLVAYSFKGQTWRVPDQCPSHICPK